MKTELFQEHLARHAKMVEFAGWQMPLNYGSQIKEHQAVREDAGIFDVSHMGIVDIKGEDAEKFLSYLLANDVAKLKENGAALYSCLLNEQGKVLDDLLAYKLAINSYRLVINAATAKKDLAWMDQKKQDYSVEMQVRNDLAMVAVQGPNALNKIQALFKQVKELKRFHCYFQGEICIARTGYTGEDGVEVMLPKNQAVKLWQDLIALNIAPCGLGARDSLRLEAGLNLYGHDMDEATTPLESNLAWTVAFDPPERDFIGRQALMQQKRQGIKRKLVGLVLEKGGILREQQPVMIPDDGEGIITSGGFSPSLGYAIALARVPNITTATATVLIRNKSFLVRVVKPPFYKR